MQIDNDFKEFIQLLNECSESIWLLVVMQSIIMGIQDTQKTSISGFG
jgi:hypothetical protein